MKIALKTSENHFKVSENHSKKSENHSNRVNFTFWGSSQRDSSFVSSCPSVRSPLKWNSLYWSDFHSFWSDFHSLRNDFHSFWEWFSLRVFLTLFTLLKSNHFTLFTLRDHIFHPYTKFHHHSSYPLSINFCFLFYAYIISRHIGNWTLTKMKKITRKLLPKLLISRTLTFNISAAECPIEIKFSGLDSADQGLQHIPL